MLNKQPIDISFAQGLDTKTDKWRVPVGKFLELSNSVFGSNGGLTKRNGYPYLPSAPASSRTLTSYKDGLVALGEQVAVYTGTGWAEQGELSQASLSVQPFIRSAANQTQADSAAIGDLTCVVYTTTTGGTPTYFYSVFRGNTAVIQSTAIPSANTTSGTPRVWALGPFFVIVYGGTSPDLYYIAISSTTLSVTAATLLSINYAPATNVPFDGVVANNTLYLAFNGSDGGGAIRLTGLNSGLIQIGTKVYAGQSGKYFSLAADFTTPTPNIYISYASATALHTLVVDANLTAILAPTLISSKSAIVNVASYVDTSMKLSLVYEIANNLWTNTVTQSGTVGTEVQFLFRVGLASKMFKALGKTYFMVQYVTTNQPSYFLMGLDALVWGRLAYQNGSGNVLVALPNATNGIAYLYKDLVEPANKTFNKLTAPNGVYTQTGVNVATWTFGNAYTTVEMANTLHISGGQLQMFDGTQVVEHGFSVYPEGYTATHGTTLGHLSAQQYYYQVIWRWTDAAGNVHRSAPGLPLSVDLSGSSTSTNLVNIETPTLQLTSKTNVVVELYRWSTAQQNFYQVTSITDPQISNKAVSTFTIVDGLADASIIGNELLYTTGGVLENTPAPATSLMTAWDSRLWLVSAEDGNLLEFSKPVIEGVPVEMSDLLTKYVAPTLGTASSSGPLTAIAPLDDKLVAFKANNPAYIGGVGPDATGANDQYTEPTSIISDVGCSNQASIVRIPQGLMFQSNKGVWLLDRGLGTSYIGADVEAFNSRAILSADPIPATNQVRFVLAGGQMLMYDYFYSQWGTFSPHVISSTVAEGRHTLLDDAGRVYQEQPGVYIDGTQAVEMSFTTAWIKLAGLQGYQRAYQLFLLGQLISQHSLAVGIAYDYNPSITQQAVITPATLGAYGSVGPYGTGAYGGEDVETYRIFLSQQRCSAFQIQLRETNSAGEGFKLSGITALVGVKAPARTQSAARSVS